jgi:6-hydroxymethylpterin diphosphokinase MptE-like/Methyltransferase domain
MSVEPKQLDCNAKQNVQYCVPAAVKFEQIKINVAKCKGRIEAATQLRTDPIALVSFGPSLNQTWEKIKEFKYVMSCSGSHKFLVEHDIIPTHHLDVDPREHKIKLIGEPQKGCEYLIASTCHPKLIDFIEQHGATVKLWHIFDSEEEGYRILPPGEWMVTGGCSVGSRTMTLARFLGFTEHHIFGMDGSFPADGNSHAAEHPNDASRKQAFETEYNGVKYRTTPSMLEAARNTWHELDMLKDVNPTFHGEGELIHAMAKDWKRKELPKDAKVFIAFDKPELISAGYCGQNRMLHQQNPMYGIGGARHKDTVLKLCNSMKTTSVLDYGCGKGQLARELPFPIWEYDPAIPGKETSPRPADLIVSTDVLEHIEPEKLHLVLQDMRRCMLRAGYFVIHTGPSSKTLPDGRNTHLIQRGRIWWKKTLKKFFALSKDSIIERPPLLYCVVARKEKTP